MQKTHSDVDSGAKKAYNMGVDGQSVMGSSYELDDVDRYVIDALRKDGRVAFSQVAERLGVSPGMIRQRYSRLAELGYLKVIAITNPVQHGLKTMAMIGIRTDGTRMLDVAN